MIYILHEKPTSKQLVDMLKGYETMIKIVVDIRRRILAGGGEMQSDCEEELRKQVESVTIEILGGVQ